MKRNSVRWKELTKELLEGGSSKKSIVEFVEKLLNS